MTDLQNQAVQTISDLMPLLALLLGIVVGAYIVKVIISAVRGGGRKVEE